MIAARKSTPLAPDGETTGLRVLVVEDHADTAASLSLLLRVYGHEARVAADGPAAPRAAHAWPPDVVILDLRLPKLDGFEVARGLRDLATEKQPLLIAVTGCGEESSRRRANEAGIDLYLLKPLDPEGLQRLLRRFQAILGK